MNIQPLKRMPDPIDEAHRQWAAHGWGGAADGMAAVTTLVRSYQQVMTNIDTRLKPFGLTFARYEVLRLLAFTRSGQMAMGQLGELLQVHPASVTNAVERLEADGLVQRVAHPDDGRSKLATVLPAGRMLIEPATTALNEYFGQVGNQVDANALRSLLNVTASVNG